MPASARHVLTRLACCLSIVAASVAAAQHDASGASPRPFTRIEPLPSRGAVPPMADFSDVVTEAELEHRARFRRHGEQLRAIRRQFFAHRRAAARRNEGIAQLREFTDPAAFRPMLFEMGGEADDVRLAMLDHFQDQGDEGQAALAWTAIVSDDAALRYESTRRIKSPPPKPVLRVLDTALRSAQDTVANNAGTLAGTLGVFESIPLLMFAQVVRETFQNEGDLAWIAINKQTAYVQRVEAIVGSGSGAFQPVPGVLNEGAILRVVDAVVVVYRTDVHRSLVSLTTDRWGESTDHLGYDPRDWWGWYNREYVGHVNEQARLAELIGPDQAPNTDDP